ncbi:DUF6515 family protein [Ferruginibacter sp.]
MKRNTKLPLTIFVLVLALAISTSVSAQRRYNDRGRHYGGYYSYNYRPVRPSVSINIGRPPVYHYARPYYSRPVYRAPYSYSYVHFGPAFGFRINILPVGYYPFYIGANPYYYYDGVYYRPYSGGGYEVTAPPLGATVKHLPSGAKVTVIDGVKYYELGGTFYQEEISAKNKLSYRVVGTDGVLNTGAGTEEDAPAPPPPPVIDNDNDNSQATTNDKVIPAPQPTNTTPEVGTRFDRLPEGSKTVILKKEKYFVSPAGVYYQEVIDGNTIRYEVTGTADQEK